MLLRAAATAAGMTIAGLAFTAGVGAGAALVGGACLARRAMKKRNAWKEDKASVSAADTLADDGDMLPSAGRG
jgi:hypothetical protein